MPKLFRPVGWFVGAGICLVCFLSVAPAAPVASLVIKSIFDGRQSDYEDYCSSSLESALFKFRSDYPSLADREEVSFLSGSNTLKGYFYDGGDKNALIVSSHGMGSLADGQESAFENYFVNKGYDLLSFDLTASGKSEGDSAGGLDQSALDFKAALDYVHSESRFADRSIFLVGYSWSAYGALASLNFDQSPKAVVSLSGFASPDLEMIDKSAKYVGFFAYASKCFMDDGLRLLRGSNGFLSAIDGANKAPDCKLYLLQGNEDQTVTKYSAFTSYLDKVTNQDRITSSIKEATHSDVFFSSEAHSYIKETITPKLNEFTKLYGSWKKIPSNVKEEFIASIDKEKTSQLDEAFFAKIDEAFSNSI